MAILLWNWLVPFQSVLEINQVIYKPLEFESMEKEKQSLQETGSKEQESYKSVFLKNGRFVTVKACT